MLKVTPCVLDSQIAWTDINTVKIINTRFIYLSWKNCGYDTTWYTVLSEGLFIKQKCR
jgi:hypothetical protein